ncbi:hypothetical protein Pyn_22251 [Prunus yedoensis var. nudiflora]|uniref:Uncharacterized protein n=1 Tax=Prunus yedoensis var. nudiflora TaxID=2094558 RepID=A0A314XQY3_PRUYE|nr:hypothetical protein Pyn_22251 [Prunus yedoensis var. nudiflora]
MALLILPRMEESSRSHSNLEMSEENDEVEIGEIGLENTMSPEETTQEPKVSCPKIVTHDSGTYLGDPEIITPRSEG